MGSFSKTEMDVAKILRSLPKLFRRSQTHRRVNCCNVDWGVKKKRSGTAPASSHRKHCNLSFSPSAPLTSIPVPENTAVIVQIPNVAALSPVSPLLFYPSGGEETNTKLTVASSSSSVSPNFRSSKKAKVRNKEWIKEHDDNLSTLYELNKKLQKESEDMRNRYQSLFAENTRLKEIKSKWEMYQKRITQEELRRQQKEEEVVFLSEEKHNLSPTTTGPTTAKVQQEPTPLATTQTQPEVPIAPPLHNQLQYHHHHQIRFSSSSQSPTLSASNISSHGGLEIPDLNACIDENGFILTDPQKQSYQPPPPPLKQQVMVVLEQRQWIGQPDPKKAATAEARKKRIEINRKKAAIAAAAAGGVAAFRGGNRAGMAVER